MIAHPCFYFTYLITSLLPSSASLSSNSLSPLLLSNSPLLVGLSIIGRRWGMLFQSLLHCRHIYTSVKCFHVSQGLWASSLPSSRTLWPSHWPSTWPYADVSSRMPRTLSSYLDQTHTDNPFWTSRTSSASRTAVVATHEAGQWGPQRQADKGSGLHHGL